MRCFLLRVCLLSAVIAPLFGGRLSVQELKTLVISSRAAGNSDEEIARRLSHVELSGRLTDAALAEIRAGGIGPRTNLLLRILADESEFEPAPDGIAGCPQGRRPIFSPRRAILPPATFADTVHFYTNMTLYPNQAARTYSGTTLGPYDRGGRL
jgi:hypothetical protein